MMDTVKNIEYILSAYLFTGGAVVLYIAYILIRNGSYLNKTTKIQTKTNSNRA